MTIYSKPMQRRQVLMLGMAMCVTTAAAPTFGQKESDEGTLQEDYRVHLEIAALGRRITESDQAIATRLESDARDFIGLSSDEKIDLGTAIQAKSKLTSKDRIYAELNNGQTIFVEGWLLSHSEAMAAVLFAAALPGGDDKQP